MRRVEQLVDQFCQTIELAVSHLDGLLSTSVVRLSGCQHVEAHPQRREWRAQLVAQCGYESVAVSGFPLLVLRTLQLAEVLQGFRQSTKPPACPPNGCDGHSDGQSPAILGVPDGLVWEHRLSARQLP